MIIAIGIYPGFTALDWVGPYQVFTNLPGAQVVLCAAERGTVNDDNNLVHLRIDASFAEVERPDVILIPGGWATRAMARDGHPIVDWVRDAHTHSTWTTSVCTGALILGAARLLTGQRATTHWAAYDTLASYGAIPTEQRVVKAGHIMTGAGVSAGIDLALTLVADLAGDQVARAIQLGIEYDPQPPYDCGAPSKAPQGIRDVAAAAIAQHHTS
ncbi:MAG TPA: DJ-1/PfpI family protein [Mycobacterium sp.]|nr:DJ-1/PfpI family protein [Mycobacterium sp.]